jgi:hypothetical protein
MALPLPVAEIGRWDANHGSSRLTKAARSADRATHDKNLPANFQASSQESDRNDETDSTNEQTQMPKTYRIQRMKRLRRGSGLASLVTRISFAWTLPRANGHRIR